MGWVFWLLPVVFSFRLIEPDWQQLIRHVIIEANATFQSHSNYETDQDFLNNCDDGLLIDPFPQFICPLIRLNSMSLTEPKGPLNTTVAETYNMAIDRKAHSCDHETGLSCVVLFLPLNRILFGCAKIDGDVLQAPAKFSSTFVVSHQVADHQQCEYDAYRQTVCSMESIFINGLIVQEQHSCCCQSGRCAVLYFDQGLPLLPFVRIVIDVDEVLQMDERVKRRKREEVYPPLKNGVDNMPDMVIFSFPLLLLIVILLLWTITPNMDKRDQQEAMTYGYSNENISELYPNTAFRSTETKTPAIEKGDVFPPLSIIQDKMDSNTQV